MKDLEDFLWSFFCIFSLALYFLRRLRKSFSVASLSLIRSPHSPSLPCSSPPPPPPPSVYSWVTKIFLDKRKVCLISQEESEKRSHEQYSLQQPEAEDSKISEDSRPSCEMKRKGLHYEEKMIMRQENMVCDAYGKGLQLDQCSQEINEGKECELGDKGATKLRKRPARLCVPEYCPKVEFGRVDRKLEKKELEVQGRDFILASKKGRRGVMEDGYGVMTNILGDSKQAFFVVIYGHGGRAAVEYVAENLGKNIVKGKADGELELELEQAIRGGYLLTDKDFLSQGVSSGACAASVLLKDGELHVANVGDCRVVLSRNGVAHLLTIDHRVSREDERLRIENSGGFLHWRNGIWRVHGSLAVSRAIGDLHLKEWIISEPEIKRVPLTSDCDFLILASDDLWDKVNEQEAVDLVLRSNKNSVESCKMLVDISFNRGNMDDITVMVIDLHIFVL